MVSLREIAAGEVFQAGEDEMQNIMIESQENLDNQETPEKTDKEAPLEEDKVQEDQSVEEK